MTPHRFVLFLLNSLLSLQCHSGGSLSFGLLHQYSFILFPEHDRHRLNFFLLPWDACNCMCIFTERRLIDNWAHPLLKYAIQIFLCFVHLFLYNTASQTLHLYMDKSKHDYGWISHRKPSITLLWSKYRYGVLMQIQSEFYKLAWSTEQISQIFVNLLNFRLLLLLGLFLLLGLLFFRSLLLFFLAFACSRSDGSTCSNPLAALSNQLMELFSLQSLNNSIEFFVSDASLYTVEDSFKIVGGWMSDVLLIFFFPERARSA